MCTAVAYRPNCGWSTERCCHTLLVFENEIEDTGLDEFCDALLLLLKARIGLGGAPASEFTIAFGMNDTTEAARERVDQMCEELGAPEIFAWSG